MCLLYSLVYIKFVDVTFCKLAGKSTYAKYFSTENTRQRTRQKIINDLNFILSIVNVIIVLRAEDRPRLTGTIER